MGTVAFQNDEVGLAGIEGIVPVRHEEVLDAWGALLRCVVVISEHPDDAMGVQEIGVLRKNVLIHLRQGASFIGVVPERYEQVGVLLLHQVHDVNLGCRRATEVAGRGETDRATVRQAAEMSVNSLTARMHRIRVRGGRLESAQDSAVEHAVFLQAIHGLGRQALGPAHAVGDGALVHATCLTRSIPIETRTSRRYGARRKTLRDGSCALEARGWESVASAIAKATPEPTRTATLRSPSAKETTGIRAGFIGSAIS